MTENISDECAQDEMPEPAVIKGQLRILQFAFCHCCHDIYFAFVSVLMPLVRARFALSYSIVGLMTVMPRIPAFFNPLIAAFAEQRQLRLLLASTPVISAICICLVGLAPSYLLVLTLLLVAGLSSAMFHVPMPVVLRQAVPGRTGSAMSAYQIGGEVARTGGPAVAAAAIAAWGADRLWILMPLAIFASMMLYRLLGRVPTTHRSREHAAIEAVRITLCDKPRFFICMFGIMLQKAFTATMLTTYLILFLHGNNHTLWVASSALALLQGAAVVGVLITGTLSDRFGCRGILVALTSLCPLSMLFFCYAGDGIAMILSLIGLGLTAFSSTPVILAMIQEQKFRYPMIANGLYMTVNFAVCSLFILLAGKVADYYSLQEMFIYFAWLSFIGLPFSLILKNR